jgi:OOP family OmpA-OmpF porin
MRKISLMIPVLKKMPLLLFLLVFVLPLSARSEIKAGSVEVTPFAGYNFFEERQNLENQPIVGARLGYNITKNFGIEGTWDFIKSYVDDKSLPFTRQGQFTNPISSVFITQYDIDLLYHFIPEQRFNPYLVAGYGIVHYTPKINNKNMSVLDFGIGAKYWMVDNIALRLDVRDNMIFDEHIHNVATTVGFVFAFGGKSTAAAPAPAPAAVAEPVVPLVTQPEPEAAPAPVVEAPLEPIPVAEPTPERMKYCITLNIEYDINKADIRPQYYDEVARVGDFMKKYPTTTAVIEGYADEVGSDDYNIQLSQRRAESVVKFLENKFGIAPSRLSAKGYGKTRPIADNASDAGKQKNRRIDAIIDCAIDVKELASPPERLCMTLKVEFATDSAEIQARYNGEVNKVGEYMKKYPTTTAVIEGHTDNIGSSELNMRLSQKRAENVVTYLVDNFGIEHSRLSAKGYGSTRRIAYNNTPEGRQKNRRINAVIDCVINK